MSEVVVHVLLGPGAVLHFAMTYAQPEGYPNALPAFAPGVRLVGEFKCDRAEVAGFIKGFKACWKTLNEAGASWRL